MGRKLGILCMSLGAALMLGALLLCLRNQWESRQAADTADAVLQQLQQHRQPAASDPTAPQQPSSSPSAPSLPLAPTLPSEPVLPDPFDPTMTEVEIDGYSYIGTLVVPVLELELPVMADWDYPRLKIAPCRYVGSTKTDDLVIAAHNYNSHFGRLKNLAPGESVYFSDMDGTVTAYEVVAVEILQPTAIEDMTAGAYDLTLFTCTYGGQSRVTVRCDRVGS